MNKINFLFGIHCHQPVGGAEAAIGLAYRKSYLPFFLTMDKHPRIKFSFHISGVIYDWLLKWRPELLDLLHKLVRRGQAEVFTGGYYQPALSVIPDADKVGQIVMQNDFIKKRFGADPRGLWLAGKAWEPHLPKILSKAGIEYVALDDRHFISAGVPEEKLTGHYVTEEEGMLLSVFPISSPLRGLIPLRKPEDVLAYLESISGRQKDASVVLWEAGEKFIHEENHFEELLFKIEEHSSWIRSATFSEYFDEMPPLGRVYLPSMKQEGEEKYFKDYFVRYPAVNNLHKKMLQVAAKLESIKKSHSPLLGDVYAELYRGQCCSSYRPEKNSLRGAAYRHLIKAENMVNKINRGAGYYTEVVITDFDKDGHEEVLMSNDQLNVYLSPFHGGSIFELDFKPKAFNVLNTDGRYSLQEHFFDPKMSLNDLREKNHRECGDFLDAGYHFFPQRKKEEVSVGFSRSGSIDGIPAKVAKKVSLLRGQSIVHIEYEITNLGKEEVKTWFGPEINLALSVQGGSYDIGGKMLKDSDLGSSGILYKVDQVRLVDAHLGFSVSLLFEKEGILSRFPAVDSGGEGEEYRGSVLVPIWQVRLQPQESWTNKITIGFET